MNLDEVRSKLNGPVFPTITPFKNNPGYEVDHDELRRYIDFLYDGGARNFYVMTYNGRFSLLSWEEMLAVNETVTRHVKEKDSDCVVIVADPMTNPTSVSIDFAKHAEKIGADVISCIFMERYHHDEQVYDHFKAIADSTSIGILIHEQSLEGIHGRCNYPIELLDRLVDIPNVIALKEDSKQPLYSEKVIEACSDRASIIISGRGKRQFIHFNNMGCQAHLVGVASFIPKVAFTFHDAFQRGDMKTAWGIINELERPFFKIGMKYGWHPVLKSGMNIVGIMSRTERPPLCSLTKEQHNEVLSVINQMRKSEFWEE
tara:strand:- start:120 stop:1067 length:948 start_codon:yes stop_codon:yes gene_type:complete